MLAGVSFAAPARTSLSVIIPAFNARFRLPQTLEDSLRFLHAANRTWELIVVDDGSTDGTASLVSKLASEPRVRLLAAPSNCGKGAALRAGACAARGERVLFMDADNGTPLSALPLLETEMSRGGFAVVVGERTETPRPPHRKLMGDVFRALASTCVSDVTDTQACAARVMRSASHADFVPPSSAA